MDGMRGTAADAGTSSAEERLRITGSYSRVYTYRNPLYLCLSFRVFLPECFLSMPGRLCSGSASTLRVYIYSIYRCFGKNLGNLLMYNF